MSTATAKGKTVELPPNFDVRFIIKLGRVFNIKPKADMLAAIEAVPDLAFLSATIEHNERRLFKKEEKFKATGKANQRLRDLRRTVAAQKARVIQVWKKYHHLFYSSTPDAKYDEPCWCGSGKRFRYCCADTAELFKDPDLEDA